MSYKSPIEIIYDEVQQELEDNVVKAVQKVGINVSKEELKRALMYDRKQYRDGYFDGMNDMKKQLEEFLEVIIHDTTI